jgi:serine/threonine-protein kinase
MIGRDRQPITKKEPAQPGDLQDGVLHVPLTFTRMIGAGGMGEVWEATSDDLPGHRFAVKVIASAHVQNREVIARFFGEARAASAIDDPNIVMIHGTGRTSDGRPALVMPYIEGRSLSDLCDERGPLPVDAVAKILLQLASALRAAHSHHIVHRDIKLQNVMVTNRWGREWFVILVDFGIAKFHDAALAREIHTNTKQYIGTPGYSAPEQILGKRVDEKADVYALGVLAYRMLCGRAPYVAENNMQVMHLQIDGAPFDEPKKLRPDMPSEWNDAIQRCLQQEPARRPTASVFAKQIAAGIQNGTSLLYLLAPRIAAEARTTASEITLSSDVPTALSQLESQTRVRRRLPALAALAVGACVGVVVSGVAFRLAQQHDDVPMHADAPPIVPARLEEAHASTVAAPSSSGAALGGGRTAEPRISTSASTGTPVDVAHADAVTARPPGAELGGKARGPTAAPPGDAVAAAAPARDTARAAASPPAIRPGEGSSPAPHAATAQLDTAEAPHRASRGPTVPPSTAVATQPIAGGDAPKPDSQRSAEKRPQTTAQQGTLHVEVDPWADVVIGDWQDTTPVTRKLPAGHHRVVLKKGSRTEVLDVVINPNQTTNVTRSW